MSERTTTTPEAPATTTSAPPAVEPTGWALSRRDPVVDAIVRGATASHPVLDVQTPGGGE